MDRAMLAALAALDSSGLLPPPDSAELAGADTVDLRIVLTVEAEWSRRHDFRLPPGPGVTRVLRLRVPVRRVTRALQSLPTNRPPAYPASLGQSRVTGAVGLHFVVDAAGVPDMATVQVERADLREFVESAVSALRAYRFRPLLVEGCPVAADVRMPFVFPN
jgi:TonB family protein